MSTPQKDFLFDVGIVLLITLWMALGLYSISRKERKLRANLKAVAQRMGWALVVEGSYLNQAVHGSVQGREVRFKNVEIHNKNSNEVYGEISVVTKARNFNFTLSRLGLSDILLEKLGDIYNKSGEAAFDRVWHLETSHPEGLRALLSPEIRAALMALVARSFTGTFELLDGRLAYREGHTFRDPLFLSRLEGMLGLMLELGSAVEVIEERMPPPPSKRDAFGETFNYGDQKKDDNWGVKSPDYDDSP